MHSSRRRGEARPRRKAKPALRPDHNRPRDTCDEHPGTLAPPNLSTAPSVTTPLHQTTGWAPRSSCFADDEEGFPEPLPSRSLRLCPRRQPLYAPRSGSPAATLHGPKAFGLPPMSLGACRGCRRARDGCLPASVSLSPIRRRGGSPTAEAGATRAPSEERPTARHKRSPQSVPCAEQSRDSSLYLHHVAPMLRTGDRFKPLRQRRGGLSSSRALSCRRGGRAFPRRLTPGSALTRALRA